MSWSPTPQDIADRYGDARTRVIGLVATLPGESAEVVVPGTPLWTVRELVSHIVGAPADFLAGNFEGAGGEAWTQAQVEARRGRDLPSLIEEWDGLYADLDAAIRGGTVPAPAAFDVITHEQDLRGALGAEPTPDPLAVRFITDGFGARFERAIATAGLPPGEIRDPASGWRAGATGGVAASASEFEWFRALTGRRSGAQVCAYEWTADPTAYLDLMCPFGPLRDSDVSD